ncbi:hypothetical protein EJB05_11666, partial [Eragrostis curvula]
MLDKALAGTRRRRFLNVSTGECIRMDLPALDDHILLTLTPEGLLLLLHQPSLVVRLLNPLTRQLTDLPPVTQLLPPGFKRIVESDDLEVSCVGVTEDATVAVYFSYLKVLAIAKPGDKLWTVVCKEHLDSALLPFAGRLYCCVQSRLMVLDTSCSNQHPKLLAAVEGGNSFRFSRMTDRLHLVDNAGELMVVHRLLYQDPDSHFRRTHKAYMVDLDARTIVPAEAFGGRAVFIGQCRTISVTAEAFPSVAGDKLYFGFDCEETCVVYQSDGYYDSNILVHPCSAINCLSHCIQGSGDHLA